MNDHPYHHGDLRRTLVDAALECLDEAGPDRLSMRDLARRAGVSHAAPAHHFGDRGGLLTAVAVHGQTHLHDALAAAVHDGADLLRLGATYVSWYVEHRALAGVLDADHLLRADDPELVAARARTRALLSDSLPHPGPSPRPDVGSVDHARVTAVWALAHGFAHLWSQGRLGPGTAEDAATAFTAVARSTPGTARRLRT